MKRASINCFLEQETALNLRWSIIMEKNTLILELKAAEGGDDSKLFVAQLATSYQKLCTKYG